MGDIQKYLREHENYNGNGVRNSIQNSLKERAESVGNEKSQSMQDYLKIRPEGKNLLSRTLHTQALLLKNKEIEESKHKAVETPKQAEVHNRYVDLVNQQLQQHIDGISSAPKELVMNVWHGMCDAMGVSEAVAFLRGNGDMAKGREIVDRTWRRITTGDPEGEYSDSAKVIQGIGNFGTKVWQYALAGDLLGGMKGIQSIKNPVVRNLVAGQAADTIVNTPKVVADGISSGKDIAGITQDVAKQQGEDLIWNLGSEAVGQVWKGVKNIKSNALENKAKKVVTFDAFADTPGVDAKNFIHSTEGLSDDTVRAIRKIQTIADTAGKDFGEVASAVYQNKTMKELRPELDNFAIWMKGNDSTGYIKRVDFDDAGKIRIDRGVKETFSMDFDDLKGVRSIDDKKSVFYFDDTELEITKKWADKFWNDLGNKSPYYRAANGDWRATSKELVDVTEVKYQPDYDIKNVPRGTFQNQDTGWEINVGSHGIGDTVSYARGKKYSISSLDKIDEIIEKSVLFDTVVSQKNKLKKSEYTAFMHKFYAPVNMDGEFQIAKITVEESVQVGAKDTYQKFYNLRNIEISPVDSGNYILLKDYVTRHIPDDTTISIADLYELVKKTDKDFYLNPKKLGERSEEIRKIVENIPSGKNSFISGELAKMSDSEIEAVIKEENLPFRDAKDVRKSAKIVDEITSGGTGHNLFHLDTDAMKEEREQLFKKVFGFSKEKFEDLFMDRYSVLKILDRIDSSSSTDTFLEMYLKSGSQSEYIKKIKFVDMQGNELGKSLDEIFAGIKKKDRRVFDEYLFHKYNVERWANGVPLNENISQAASNRIYSSLEELHPEFKSVSEELYAFNNTLNYEYGVQTGIISETWFDNATTVYPSYVPTFREYGGTVDAVRDAEKTGHNISGIFKKAGIRHEKVYDVKKLFENKIDIIVNAARKQELQADIVKKILHNPVKLQNVGKILDIAKESTNVRGEAMQDGAEILSYLKKLYAGNVDEQFTMSAYIDGKLYTVGISERLHNAFSYVTAGGNQTLKIGAQKTIDFFGKHVTGNFKKVVTALNPLYSASNVARDLPNALIATKGSMGDMAKGYPEAIAKILQKDDTWKQFCALGGADSGMLENVGKSLLQKNYNPIKWISRMNGFTEAVPRYAEFLISLKNDDDVYTAIKNAADVTVNFGRGGRLSKNIDKGLVPYFNARMQGFYHSARTMRRSPFKTINRAAIALTIPTVVLYTLNKDNPHYQDLRERQKNYYFNIPMMNSLDVNGYPTKFIKLPKTDQFGFVFGTMMEKGLRLASGDEEAFDNFWGDLSDGFMPFNTRNFTENFYSPAWKAVVDNMILGKTDIVDFAGRPVIYKEMQDLPATQQYDENTSGIAIWMGQSFGISPKVVDYLISSYTGIIGETVLPFTKPNVENPWSQPIDKRFVVDSLYSNDISDKMHDMYMGMKFLRNKAEEEQNYPEYYKYSRYTSDLGQTYEKTKQIKVLIDNLVANGASKDSEAVRILRNQYLECYKDAIVKYDGIELPQVDDSAVKNSADIVGITDTWYNLYSVMRSRREDAKAKGNDYLYGIYADYVNELWTAHEYAKRIKTKIDYLVGNGASMDSDDVRSFMREYTNCYQYVINKYDPIVKGR